ncbi:M23 family metallopeptidase [Marivibrio halodurans]|uniref:M23 family metallopeptidase n=1 Tax=Marivibrio halodurans TaxID=2039722 RepID=A0A8J7SJQ5_9PROT|nr:M23 family metallopeptidase [Marivibrio halodurans]MBP5857918.1 M23 family metallopeptidase [Marivibrio halodurans]
MQTHPDSPPSLDAPSPNPARRLVLRAAAAAAGLVLMAVTLYFALPGNGPNLLPEPGIDAALAAPAQDGDPISAHPMPPERPRVAAISDAASNAALLSEPYRVTLTVESGDTLMGLLTEAGLDPPQAHRAIQALAEVYSPRKLRPGHSFDLLLEPSTGDIPATLRELTFAPDLTKTVRVTRAPSVGADAEKTFLANATDRPVITRLSRSEGAIDSSLYNAAVEAGVPMPILGEMINIFSFDIDFQREIQPDDRFALLFEEQRAEDGRLVDTGDVLMAEMTVRGEQRRYYRFEDENGFVDFYDASGRSVRKALLRTPVDGARISSRFGKRTHPILGYTRMHKGMDFAAPTGTPIYAAGDGVVEAAGWNGGYGKYVRIRHNGTYKTAYAHMSRIDSRVKAGTRVRQRQIIGYVGTTGRSTGPHLHYEVHQDGRQVNPQGVKLPTGKVLAGADLTRFETVMRETEARFATAPDLSGTDTAAAIGANCQASGTATC